MNIFDISAGRCVSLICGFRQVLEPQKGSVCQRPFILAIIASYRKSPSTNKNQKKRGSLAAKGCCRSIMNQAFRVWFKSQRLKRHSELVLQIKITQVRILKAKNEFQVGKSTRLGHHGRPTDKVFKLLKIDYLQLESFFAQLHLTRTRYRSL